MEANEGNEKQMEDFGEDDIELVDGNSGENRADAASVASEADEMKNRYLRLYADF